ncbi:hypothetical protein EV702DRAFT_1270649 [Suillus placidus]|uniref:O-methyltransferase C-terminal domain-containing protein n=1 Tax=Suillus placidus TaxID=48579 RepID=A0A9P6ZMH6_9AGAM|nr:hypothetical protein EV702DRAFT_1270649 [Suillus placidus]
MDEKYSMYGAACIDTLVKTSIIDYLSDVSNPSEAFEGVPAAELASTFELDSQKLVPILRFCAANGWVRETHDSSFALNRCSRTFIKGHAGQRLNLCSRQEAKSSGTPGFMSLVGLMPNWVTESGWKLSRSPMQTGFQIAYKTPLHQFAWFMQNPQTLVPMADHLQVSISVFGDMSTPSIVADYPWEQLETPIIVDCGGGQGALVSAIPDVQVAYVIFLIYLNSRSWQASFLPSPRARHKRRPRDIESGMIRVEAHDFFQSQPRIGNEYSFILRHILHDWPDKEASKMLIDEMVAVPNVDSTATTSAKSFLLDSDDKCPNYNITLHFGSASKLVNALSVQMLTLMNGCERLNSGNDDSPPHWINVPGIDDI